MQFLSAETRQAFTRKVILPLASLLICLLLFATGGIFWVADYQTRVAIEQEARLASGAFRIQAEKLAANASDYGYWDDAVTAIVDRVDPTWLSENLGAGAEKSLGIDMAFALDPVGHPVYSYVHDKDGQSNPVTVLGDGFRRVFLEWKTRPANDSAQALMPYGDTAVVIAIAPVRSYKDPGAKPTGYSIVFAKIVDDNLLKEVARDFELTHFRVARSPADVSEGRATVEIRDARAITRFAWEPRRPGNGLLEIALPFMGLFLILLALLAGVVLNYVIASAQLLSDREMKASCDALTGLANRARFFRELDVAMSRVVPGVSGVTVMYVDLDGFKTINDTMGHAAGDELLLAVAGRFKACLSANDLVARLGGDEFAIIVQGGCDATGAQAIAGRILLSVSQTFHLRAGAAEISCSIGIASTWQKGAAGADLLNRADHSLYEAKASGKNAMRLSLADDADEASRKVA